MFLYDKLKRGNTLAGGNKGLKLDKEQWGDISTHKMNKGEMEDQVYLSVVSQMGFKPEYLSNVFFRKRVDI